MFWWNLKKRILTLIDIKYSPTKIQNRHNNCFIDRIEMFGGKFNNVIWRRLYTNN